MLPTNDIESFIVVPSARIMDLRHEIEKDHGSESRKWILLFKQTLLKDDDTFQDQHVRNGSLITVLTPTSNNDIIQRDGVDRIRVAEKISEICSYDGMPVGASNCADISCISRNMMTKKNNFWTVSSWSVNVIEWKYAQIEVILILF